MLLRLARSLSADFRHRQPTANLAGQNVGNFRVPRHSFNLPGRRIRPESMAATLPFQDAAMTAKVSQ
jgi:hypothetical protein